MLSALITTPPKASAAASASADLPLAVGPTNTSYCALSAIARQDTALNVMNTVVTLIAADPIVETCVDAVCSALGGEALWLAEGIACDIASNLAPEAAESAARKIAGGAALDIAAQPVAGKAAPPRRRYGSTIIEMRCSMS